MSTLLYFLKAWVIGIVIAAPVGPIGMLCIKKTLELGMNGALLVGLGAALADCTYGFIAALGFTVISDIMLSGGVYLKLIGGMSLLYIAYREAKSSSASKEACVSGKSRIKLVSQVYFLTMTSPVTILTFVGIFASISAGSSTRLESIMMMFGIFFGSMTWWCILGAIITKIKGKLPKIWLGRIKWISCFILGSFGLAVIFSNFVA